MRNKEGDPNSTQDKCQEIVHITKLKIAFSRNVNFHAPNIVKITLLDSNTDFQRENSNIAKITTFRFED